MTTFFPALPCFVGFTAFTPEVPKLYWDVKSQEQRILEICRHLDKLTKYSDTLAERINDLDAEFSAALDEFMQEITKRLNAQDTTLENAIADQNKNLKKQMAQLKTYVDMRFDDIAEGQMIYDVTTGTYRSSPEAMRRIYSALAYSNTGDRALVSDIADNLTVAQLADMTVYHAAWSDRDTITIDDQVPALEGVN